MTEQTLHYLEITTGTDVSGFDVINSIGKSSSATEHTAAFVGVLGDSTTTVLYPGRTGEAKTSTRTGTDISEIKPQEWGLPACVDYGMKCG